MIKAGIYVRLSRDDERLGESMSIENQKLMLTDYCRRRGFQIVDTYADDGYSGLNFSRPQVQRLIGDAKLGRINTIVVKDLSRFGRNYAECGRYIDDLFPMIGCRFIAVNDGVDTAKEENDIVPMMNIFNEIYSRDIGRKVRSAKIARAGQGKYLGAYAPYGYEKSEHGLVIDNASAEIVRRIFQMRIDGWSCCKIAGRLNEMGVAVPRDYYYQKLGKPNPRKISHKWTDGSVSQILKNEVYIGNLVQYKTRSVSVKNKKPIQQNPEDMIRCENAHEAIVDVEIWNRVQAMRSVPKQKSTTAENVCRPLFTGLLKCADCGNAMKFCADTNRRKDGTNLRHHAYTCGTYRHGGKNACSSHYIQERTLAELVRSDLEQFAEAIGIDEDLLRRKLLEERSRNMRTERISLENMRRQIQNRLSELDAMLGRLYDETLLGKIPREVLIEMAERYRTEKFDKERELTEINNRLREFENAERDVENWIGIVKEYMDCKELDSQLLHRLIKAIYIGEAQIKDGEKIRDIEIEYRFR